MVTAEHIGKLVTDGQRTGVLMDLIEREHTNPNSEYRESKLYAYVRPEGGGIEWDAPPDALEPV
ncbi:hypothetical protein IAG44_17750 [Streptomyces roseirectus]|uniref:Uncharacterized protein n=1 Tax=Streptomyces roseirectus TaxID=2768066 RepID=A0A7H0IE83_9ACTN|nr:hypothetical protein [Streptomyces roseirectus]QNP71099.1 hypothetical protein IAG44_17750 [Streptomyces roseirectus]